jgi:hypothetical protein
MTDLEVDPSVRSLPRWEWRYFMTSVSSDIAAKGSLSDSIHGRRMSRGVKSCICRRLGKERSDDPNAQLCKYSLEAPLRLGGRFR